MLPPGLRSALSYRALCALARRMPPDAATVTTNMGITRGLRCEVPAAHYMARFGKPSLYRGERGALALAAHLTRRCDAFLDVGAHIGFFTLHVRASVPDATPIYFFEPDAELFARLSRNVLANDLPNVRGFQAAMAAADGSGTFYANRTDSLSGSLLPEFHGQHQVAAEPVSTISFATATSTVGCSQTCVKVDVEGAEQEFLDGADGAYARIAYLIMEVLGPAVERGFVAQLVQRTGLRAYYINDYQLEPSTNGAFTYRSPEYNWLFAREAPADLQRVLAGSRMRVKL